jgi:hypothetical protein
MFLINHTSVSLDKLYFNITFVDTEHTTQRTLNLDIISKANHIANSSVMIHHSIVNKTGKFNIIQYEDWDYWKRALKYTDCLYISDPLVYYTFTINNGSNIKFYS